MGIFYFAAGLYYYSPYLYIFLLSISAISTPCALDARQSCI